MDEYTKSIKLEFKSDDRSFQDIQKKIESLGKLSIGDTGTLSSLQKQLTEQESLKSVISELQSAQKLVSGLGTEESKKVSQDINKRLSELTKELNKLEPVIEHTTDKFEKINQDMSNSLKNEVTSAWKKLATWALNSLKSVLTDAVKDMKDMLEYSQLSNQQTRELAFGYGFSSSEAYAWTNALEAVGLSSEEDLFYANTQELEQFREAFETYSSYYEDLYDSGFFEEMQEYQYEMKMFKNELTLEVVDFFMDNKDTIMSAMRAVIKIAEKLLDATSWFNNLLSGGKTASTSDIVSQYNSTTSSNTNVSFVNNYSNADSSEQTWMQNIGALTYEQIMKALA